MSWLDKFSLMGRMPEPDLRYCWELQWLFEDENCPPHIEKHSDPQTCLQQMISLWNSPRTLIHMSISRRNA